MGHCCISVDYPSWPEPRPELDRARCNRSLCRWRSHLELYQLSVTSTARYEVWNPYICLCPCYLANGGQKEFWAQRAGNIAFTQIPLLPLLAGKNNFITCELSRCPMNGTIND